MTTTSSASSNSFPRRRFLQGAGAGLAVGALAGYGGSFALSGRSSHADLVIYNGNVLTLSGEFRPFEALAVKDGVVHTVGESADVRRLIGGNNDVMNLRGRTVVPGINDSHFHPMGYGTNQPPLTLALGREHVSSIAEIRDLVAEAVENAEPGEWIRGFGWDQGYLDEVRYPTKEDIDEVSPQNPVILREWSGHSVWVNSVALEMAGIDEDSEAPPGGEIFRHGDGEPTGVLTEGDSYPVNELVPDFTEDQQRQALELAADAMHAEGITSTTDAGTNIATVQMYNDLLSSGRMRQRMTVMLGGPGGDAELEEALRAGREIETDPPWLNVSQFKMSADGVPTQAMTAWMSEEYEAGGHGSLVVPGDSEEVQLETLYQRISLAHELGYQVGIHSCGDRAIDAVVEAYDRVIGEQGDKGLRHYVIHGDFISSQSLSKLSSHGLGVNFNPSIKRSLSHQLVDVLGRDRTNYQWPYRSALAAGVVVASASDAPVVPPHFREGITAMLTRRSLATGEVFGEEETIELEDALLTYTKAGAWQDAAEDWKGTLGEGMAADLVVLDGDLLNTSPEDIVDIPVGFTVVGGEVVYDVASATIPLATASAAAVRDSGLNTYMKVGCCGADTGRHEGARI
ncbi:amidohydrolase [Nesterenkonia haasae]|uniref:amidohydrolase n=1 Tax=Nesterenkonia haasae TaxID=2587813 RepID=UPI001391C482|nr:amidohydrolase [Nesterenkonia haasae]NDK32066.1 amidohydrolase [Nesterenkonia haasae]